MGESGDFFEVPPPPPSQFQLPKPRPWEPPNDIQGVEVPLELVIARSPKIAAVVGHITAYPNGFSFSLSLRSKPGHEMAAEGFHGWRRRPGRGRWVRELPKDVFRFGVVFADGSTATNLKVFGFGAPAPPTPPILLGGGGGGSGSRYELSYWIWPLPPAGPMALVTEWPAERLPLTRFEIDSGPIRSAGMSATPVGSF
jgi:hypothetical protein